MPEKSAVTAGRLKHSPAVADQLAHAIDDSRRGEYLAESGNIAFRLRRNGRHGRHIERQTGRVAKASSIPLNSRVPGETLTYAVPCLENTFRSSLSESKRSKVADVF
jgi:hypothetical protein